MFFGTAWNANSTSSQCTCSFKGLKFWWPQEGSLLGERPSGMAAKLSDLKMAGASKILSWEVEVQLAQKLEVCYEYQGRQVKYQKQLD